MNRKWLWLLVGTIMAIGIAACRPAAPPAELTATPTQTVVATPTSHSEAVEEATVAPTPADLMQEAMVMRAKSDLAQRLDVELDQIALIEAQAVEWGDESLSCPQSGMVYAQVITPGFRIVLEAEGERHEYHTDREQAIVPCHIEDEEPEATKEATVTAIPTAPTPSDPTQRALLTLAKDDLSERLSIEVDEIGLAGIEAVEWGDTSLGCPQPGMMYAQVITPGYRVVLETGGKRYEYHTDRVQTVVLCGEGDESPKTPVSQDPLMKQMVTLAMEDLAAQLSIDVDQIELLDAQAVEWRDSSLGCPQPGMMYAQVITPGFRIVLEAEGEKYEYHTDADRTVALCKE